MKKEITMAKIPVKVKKRFSDSLKKYKPILTRAEKQDLNESDTVTIIVICCQIYLAMISIPILHQNLL